MSNKVTRKQIRANEALEKRKYQRRLSKSNPNKEITSDIVNEQISISHVDRIQNMLPLGIKVFGSTFQPKRKKIDPRHILPYQSLKKYVHWLPVNQQDATSSVTLTKELEEFCKYVAVSAFYYPARLKLTYFFNSWTKEKLILVRICYVNCMKPF